MVFFLQFGNFNYLASKYLSLLMPMSYKAAKSRRFFSLHFTLPIDCYCKL